VKQRARGIVMGIACFALGIAVQRGCDALRVMRPEVTKTVQLSTPAAGPPRQTPKPVWTVAPVDRSKIDYSNLVVCGD
jgi:hypothetical protein